MGALQPWHLIILVLVVVILFGAKRLPDAARSIGKSMKIFKAETKDMRNKEEGEQPPAEPTAPTVQAEAKQIPATPAPAPAPAPSDQATSKQVEDLQRQLDELKKQQAATPAEQAQKNANAG
ncbi:Sec-independent protein translocase subunit TatA [Amycolatopsis suaedae]|uniref:Sec-independent protein translocase protein TatA n=1 Tax=Amycolatopsis suaedae TaxID=2510978 RepID=A0A4Q7JBM2_9PSEU|nr:Sec-independent protein translocase subunit TatA [Amycolatopsis suaedae]RZQ63664.1 twin-arginine translocase TatA/TatE family subunit [Amycolatopsis suaedae]